MFDFADLTDRFSVIPPKEKDKKHKKIRIK